MSHTFRYTKLDPDAFLVGKTDLSGDFLVYGRQTEDGKGVIIAGAVIMAIAAAFVRHDHIASIEAMDDATVLLCLKH